MQHSPSSEPNRFAASQKISWEFMEPEGSLPHSHISSLPHKSVLYKYCGSCGLGFWAPDRKMWKALLYMVMCLQVV